MAPCDVCGEPTRSKYGVCHRTRECHNLASLRQRVASPATIWRPCEVCTLPTNADGGVCNRTPACRRTRRRRRASRSGVGPVRVSCEICGEPTTETPGICTRSAECRRIRKLRLANRDLPTYGPCEICGQITRSAGRVCKKTQECRNERDRRRESRAARPHDPRPCDICGRPTESTFGVCQKTPECQREFTRRRRAADPVATREAIRAYRQREDRPCRYAKAGCVEFSVPGVLCCQKHQIEDNRRHRLRQRTKAQRRLAEMQGWLCTWCDQPLPDDLAQTEIDHVIPKASGVVIEDDWNLRLLHSFCNRTKYAKITPEALALAAEHGITLPVVTAA